jgi:hypothetical protein
MERIVTTNLWPEPVRVWGYDDTFPLAGDLYEAETNCVKQHNLGQIASNGLSNMAFFSRKPPVTATVKQNPVSRTPPAYNRSKTYVALVLGDGDNLNFIKGSRRDWMEQRLQFCAASPGAGVRSGCFPLLWTLSPQTLRSAPDLLHWYYNKSYETKQDWFVLPPSGDTYSYPGLMQPADQASFVARTEEDCRLMDATGTVAWEFMGTWPSAVKNYFPRYSDEAVVSSLYAVNVPYMIPTGVFALGEQYRVLGARKNVVLFAPNEWRGGKGGGPQERSAADQAKWLGGQKGQVLQVYITSDGGANLGLVYDMQALLPEHVQLVNHKELAELALQRSAALRRL